MAPTGGVIVLLVSHEMDASMSGRNLYSLVYLWSGVVQNGRHANLM